MYQKWMKDYNEIVFNSDKEIDNDKMEESNK